MELLDRFYRYEASFRGQDAIDWTAMHTDVPVFAVSIYLAVVFRGSTLLENQPPMKLKATFAIWNLALSVFSIIGAAKSVPRMIQVLRSEGLHYSICADPEDWYLNGAAGLWTTLFVYSKLPELGDTMFLVVQKKPIIFLHWFHHVTVLLYCWHAFVNRTSTGFWFVTMNYSVHSIMYTYYFCATVGLRKIVRRIAPLITSLQLAQMFVGCFVTSYSAYAYWSGSGKRSCHVDPANFKMGLGMYFSYLVLFAMFFYTLYLAPGARYALFDRRKDETYPAVKPEDQICGVDVGSQDSAGMFRGQQDGRGPSTPPSPSQSTSETAGLSRNSDTKKKV